MGAKVSMSAAYATKNLGMGFEEAIEGFLRSRKLGNGGANKPCAPRTLFEYRYDLKRFFKFFDSKHQYNQISEKEVLSFLDHWQDCDLSEASKSKLLRTLRAFFHWIEKDGECRTNGMKSWNDVMPKISHTAGRIYVPTTEVMSEFLNTFDTSVIWGLRDFVVTSILIDCGPRIGEICNLTLESVLWEQNKLLLRGKTGPRVVPVSHDITIPNLKRWVRERSPFAKTDALFVTKFGGTCTPNTFDQSFGDARLKSGVGVTDEGTLTPHTVRHYFCTHYLINGGTLPGLQAITGHMSLATLQIYLHMAQQHAFIAKEHAEASPLQSLKRTAKKRKMY